MAGLAPHVCSYDAPVAERTDQTGEALQILPPARDSRLRGVQRFNAVYFAVLAAWALGSVFAGHPALGLLAAGFFVELTIVAIRVGSHVGGVVLDTDAVARVATPLHELCERAGCRVPTLAIRDDRLRAAYVLQRKQTAILYLSQPYPGLVDARELRALLAHEVIHIARGDAASGQRRARIVAGVTVAAFAVVGFTVGSTTTFPLVIAAVLVAERAVLAPLSLTNRRREIRADVEGAALAGDPEALARAIETADAMSRDMRALLYGPPPWSWLLAPVTWRLPTHPQIATRIQRLRVTVGA